MNTRIYIIAISLLISCDAGRGKIEQGSNSIVDSYNQIYEDSLNKVRKEQVSAELNQLADKRIVGQWECTLSGYESIISFYKIGNTYKTSVEFINSNSKIKNEDLQNINNKYPIKNSKSNEYYVINKDGNLEF